MDSNDTILFIVLIVLLALSAFFSSAETALTTVNRIRIRNLADEGNKNAKTVLKITDDSSKMLTAILIGNNIVNLSAASLTTTLAYSLGGSMVAIASGILTVAILLFGEITPKTMATIHAEKVSLAYKEYSKCKTELGSMNMNEEQRNRELAFLEFEIKEIEKANLQPGEDEELEARYRKMSNAKLIVDSLQLVHNLTGYESKEGAGETVGEALKEFSHVTQYDPELTPLAETLTSVDGLLNDFNRELSAYLDELTFDEGEFYETERRLDLINGLKAKYGRTIEEIFTYRKLQEEKLEKLHKYEENLQELKEHLRELENILEKKSDELAEIRKEYSKQLEQKIIQGLKDLNFLDVNFAIDFRKKKNYTDNGTDDIQYLISTNPGETLKPLGQIVSGGELSRIMLALKAILADRDEIETLIFDEIDTGISGRTAQKVSEKMAVIGQHHQVLCITHLPQIAAMADSHFEIEKHLQGTETITQIHVLKEHDSIRELARLLGGAEITPAVFENAKEMKELAQKQKNTRFK